MFRLILILFILINLVWIFSQNSYTRQLGAAFWSSSQPVATPFPSAEIPVMDSPFTSPSPAQSEAPIINIKQPGLSALLHSQQYVYQTYNNCGPATLSMLLDFYGVNITQQQIADQLRPYNNTQGYNDDKSVTLDELASFARKQNMVTFKRANGDLDKIKKLITNGMPVITITWIDDKGGFGHYRIIKGYDDLKQEIIQDDSIFGQGKKVKYDEFMRLWQVFNYDYLVIVPSEKAEIVKNILGNDIEEKAAFTYALKRSQAEQSSFATFNQSINYYYLGEYENSIKSFELVKSQVPYRLIWYQIEPIMAYQKMKKFDQVFSLTDQIIQSGNPAFSEIYQIRGEIYLEKGEIQNAKKELEKAVFFNKYYQPASQLLQSI